MKLLSVHEFRSAGFMVVVFAAMTIGGSAMSQAVSTTRQHSIRVMTYNIHHGEGNDKKLDLDRIATIVKSENPDVVCLQEIDKNQPRTQQLDFPKLLGEKLGMSGVFECNYPFNGGEYGNATFSRFPIASHENVKLPTPSGVEPRGCLRVTLQIGNDVVDVLNAHLGLDAKQRQEQVDVIASAIHNIPTILAGDFNECFSDPAIGAILGRMRDSASATPKKIDFIFISNKIDAVSSSIVVNPDSSLASDHFPWIADLVINSGEETSSDRGVYDNDDERVLEAVTGRKQP
jgi:endonuclease/exonuclease/phosphatase family metal-dependent hydrolase